MKEGNQDNYDDVMEGISITNFEESELMKHFKKMNLDNYNGVEGEDLEY